MLRFARECGIQGPESRVVGISDADVVLVKRFDHGRTNVACGERTAGAVRVPRAGA